MRRVLIFIIFLILFSWQNVTFATENYSFIYINGSNNNNEKMRNWYMNGVKKLHPVLRSKFLNSTRIKKMFSKANYEAVTIDEEPVIYFWGNKSKEDLEFLKIQCNM